MELIGNNARQFEIGAALHSPIMVQLFLQQLLVGKFRGPLIREQHGKKLPLFKIGEQLHAIPIARLS
jgi:hypothetical protein